MICDSYKKLKAMNDELCFLESKFKCRNKSEPLTECGPVRIQNFIKHSKFYGDTFHQVLEDRIRENPELTVRWHRNCSSSYTSTVQVAKHKRKISQSHTDYIPPKTRRRSSLPPFIFNKHC